MACKLDDSVAAKIIIFCLSFIVANMIGTWLSDANAAPSFTGSETNCNNVGRIALTVADARDSGLDWVTVKTDLGIALANAVKNNRSYIKTQDDVDTIVLLFKQVYDDKTLDTQEAVYLYAYGRCMEIKSSQATGMVLAKGGGKGGGKAPKAGKGKSKAGSDGESVKA